MMDTSPISSQHLVTTTDKVKWVRWTPPELPWFKLNTDGASKGNPGLSGSGGLIRDYRGYWISGFMTNIGEGDAVQAELCAIHIGLQLAWDIGVRQLILESDSEVALQKITQGREYEYEDLNSPLISSIKEQLGRDWIVQIQHVYREGNSCADNLANKAVYGLPLGVTCSMMVAPADMVSLLQEDIAGTLKPRFMKNKRRPIVSRNLPPRLIHC